MASSTEKVVVPDATEQSTIDQTTNNEPTLALDVNGNEVSTEGLVQPSGSADAALPTSSEETAAAQTPSESAPADSMAPASSSTSSAPTNTSEKSPAKLTETTKTEEELFKETMTKKMRHAFSVFDSTGNGTCDGRHLPCFY